MPAFKLIGALFALIGHALVFSWPVSITLLGILFSELPHAPRHWERRHLLAFLPAAISLFMVAWTVAAIAFPPLRIFSLGILTGQLAMVAELAAAGYAFCRLEGHRCFFLSLLLLELWVGYWATSIAGILLHLLRFGLAH